MKKIYHITFAITLWLTVLLGNNVFGQAYYSGGQGGGYSTTTISNSTSAFIGDSITAKKFDVTVFPNPLTSNDIFKAKLTGINQSEKVSIIVTDMIGSKIFMDKVEASDELTINLPYERLSKGIYLIIFQHNNHKITRRFNYNN